VSLFSGLNNLRDITLVPKYATICGYTEMELKTVFARHLKDKPIDKIRKWYNGYSWLGERVYNPFSILNYLEDGTFCNYWFESGTPEFLIKLFLARKYLAPSLQNKLCKNISVNSFFSRPAGIEFLGLKKLGQNLKFLYI
jgi:hypothetical protein